MGTRASDTRYGGSHLVNEIAQRSRCSWTLRRQRRGLAVQVQRHDFEESATIERRVAGERLVCDDAERVDITWRGDVAAGGLLGSHVRRRPHR